MKIGPACVSHLAISASVLNVTTRPQHALKGGIVLSVLTQGKGGPIVVIPEVLWEGAGNYSVLVWQLRTLAQKGKYAAALALQKSY